MIRGINLAAPDRRDDVPFSAYAKHTQELEDAINEIIRQFHEGNYSFSLNFDDDISDDDVAYIQAAVEDRIGVDIF